MITEDPWQGKGYEETKRLPDGRAAGLMQLLFGGRICIGDPEEAFGYSEAYDYDDMETARLAFEWDPDTEGEPTGWVRHIPSYRRRPAGNPDREYIAP